MGNDKIIIPVILTSVLVLTVIAILAPAAVATPNENANERAKVGMPENAVEIAPGIYSLGKYEVDGTMIEGFLVLHHDPGHTKGPPGSGEEPPPPDPESDCFSFLGENIGWKKPESWVMNSANNRTLDEHQIFLSLSGSITDWENVADKNILGNGQETTEELIFDWTFPTDGVNEVFFTDIEELAGVTGAIAGTGVWVRTPPSGNTIIFEWDQIYDDTHFDWSLDAPNDDTGDPVIDPDPQMDFKNIAMHEIGHAMGMGHPDNSCTEETMYYRAGAEEDKKRTLEEGDMVGIQILY